VNKHELVEMLAGILGLAAFVAIPFLAAIAYRGYLQRIRANLSTPRRFLGMGSLVCTVMSWGGYAYLAFAVSTRKRTDFFTDAWMVAAVLVSLSAIVLSLALKGRPRIWALVATSLMSALWTMSYLGGQGL
jgi:hypothetical protein